MAFIGEATFPGINQGINQGTGLVPTAPAPVQPPGGTDVASTGGPNAPSAPTSGQTDTANSGPKSGGPASAYAWLLAWGVILAVLALINHTRIGHAAIYYTLLLLLFFVLLSNYRFIQTSLAPFQTLGQSK